MAYVPCVCDHYEPRYTSYPTTTTTTSYPSDSDGSKVKYRSDRKCGAFYPLPDGKPSECNPMGYFPCCLGQRSYHINIYEDGQCVAERLCIFRTNTLRAVNYRTIYQDWIESEGKQRWRYDGGCGIWFNLPDGLPAECDPNGDKPCCDSPIGRYPGRCGNTESHCNCENCVNFTRVYEDWKKSGGNIKWRKDDLCGPCHPLPDGTAAECNPDGDKPCCNTMTGKCGFDVLNCVCDDCIDYRVLRAIRTSGKNCAVVKLNMHLKYVCYNETTGKIFYKCWNSDDIFYETRSKRLLTVYAGHRSFQALIHPSDIGMCEIMRERHIFYAPCSRQRAKYTDYIVSFNVKVSIKLDNVTALCDNDPYSYQACGFRTGISNSDVLCGGYFCKQEESTEHTFLECSGDHCKVDGRNCNKSRLDIWSTSQDYCNDKCDNINCEDEGYCRRVSYGVQCGQLYLSPQNVCDGTEQCDNGSDERNCNINNNTKHTCTHHSRNVSVPVFDYTRCSIVDYCSKDSIRVDQTNCSDKTRVGGNCEVNGFYSRISKYVVCKEDSRICDDGLHNKCISPSYIGCKIQKHKMCDGVKDCIDEGDEIHETCEIMTSHWNFTCQRRFTLKSIDSGLPISWIMDGFTDCINGEDEDQSKWTVCPGTVRQIPLPGVKCENLFICPGKDRSFVRFDKLCDGVETCTKSGEGRVCHIARDFPDSNKEANYIQNSTVRSLCQKTSNCGIKEFRRPWGDVFGEPKMQLFLPMNKINCSRLFGENYLFLSCMDLCLEENVVCPLDNETRKLDYNSCPSQFPDRAYTIANNSFLTFVDKSDSGYYHQNFYKCNNGRCVEYKQVCDLVDDCGDMSDEMDCANHMICEDTLKSTKHHFISISHKCDGIYDCFDLSDECNELCRKHILENWVLKSLCWFMGVLAVLFNLFTIVHGLISIRSCRTGATLITKALMSLIGSGDFLIGLYLIILSVYDSIMLGSSYCRRQPEWLTGVPCKVLGVISTVGSQVSVFSMTLMSFIKMYGVTLRSMRIPSPVNKKAVAKVIFMASTIVISSLAIALIPLVPSLEDYFVQGMYYDPSYKVFIGFPNKDRHMKVLQEYYKSEQNISNNSLSWKEIGEKVDGMFTQDYGLLTRNPVHFYGNDGVCLYKYFVRTDDARRSRKSSLTEEEAKYFQQDPVVWIMLAVNLICFIIITVCYIRITWKTGKSTRQSGQCDNPERRKENRNLQRRVMLIIATDFLCWVPFIFVSALHNLRKIDASSWYVPLAMTVLPINSVINPLIYNKALVKMIKIKLGVIGRFIRQGVTVTWSTLAGVFRRDNEDVEPENIPMEVLNQ